MKSIYTTLKLVLGIPRQLQVPQKIKLLFPKTGGMGAPLWHHLQTIQATTSTCVVARMGVTENTMMMSGCSSYHLLFG